MNCKTNIQDIVISCYRFLRFNIRILFYFLITLYRLVHKYVNSRDEIQVTFHQSILLLFRPVIEIIGIHSRRNNKLRQLLKKYIKWRN